MSRRSFITLSAITVTPLALDRSKPNALAATMGNKTSYAVVVIGAGLGGLCAAGYLSKFGVPVTVVEQHTIPGGYATAFERGDFTFEVSLHHISINNNNTAAILEGLGILDKLQLISLPGQQDAESLVEVLSKQFPSERDGIKGFITEINGISDEISDLSKNKGKSGRFSLSQYPKIWSAKDKTLADLLGGHVRNPELKDLLASGWGAYGLPPSKLSAFFFAAARACSLKNQRSKTSG